MFGRATIRLGIGPHSSLGLYFVFIWFSLDYLFLAVIVLDLVSLVLFQETG